jgi:hypothetical protein
MSRFVVYQLWPRNARSTKMMRPARPWSKTKRNVLSACLPLFPVATNLRLSRFSLRRRQQAGQPVQTEWNGGLWVKHSGAYYTTNQTIALGAWYNLGIRAVVGPLGTGTVEIWLNGARVYSTSVASLGTAPVATVQIGNETPGQAFTLVADDISVSGPDSPPPTATPPPTSTVTPTPASTPTRTPTPASTPTRTPTPASTPTRTPTHAPTPTRTPAPTPTPASFSFGAAGDLGATSNTSAVLNAVDSSNLNSSSRSATSVIATRLPSRPGATSLRLASAIASRSNSCRAIMRTTARTG